jgi:hypothetical protein
VDIYDTYPLLIRLKRQTNGSFDLLSYGETNGQQNRKQRVRTREGRLRRRQTDSKTENKGENKVHERKTKEFISEKKKKPEV